MNDDARAIIDTTDYATLATADAGGTPWASPVWFAVDEHHATFLWVSSPDARHSANIAVRPQIALVVFDSHAAIGHGQGVYVEATARMLTGPAAAAAITTFDARSRERGGAAWSPADVQDGARLRLYAADVTRAWTLDAFDERVPA